MRKAKILYKDEEAGVLTQHDDASFTFKYNDAWLADNNKPGISLTLPKNRDKFHSKFLFSFFYNMLPKNAEISEKIFNDIMSKMSSKSDSVEKMITASFLNDSMKRDYWQSYNGRLKQLSKR